jgi:hypothetical protein
MTTSHLKYSQPASEPVEDDVKVLAIVESTLSDIETRGDAAIRDLSAKYDEYAPPWFLLSTSEIEALMQKTFAQQGRRHPFRPNPNPPGIVKLTGGFLNRTKPYDKSQTIRGL